MASVLGKLAGRGVGVAAQGAAGVAGATTGFVGAMISPLLNFFNDIIKQRVAAADEATKKREARDDKIVEICEAIWKEPIVTQRLVVEKEMPPAPSAPRPEGATESAVNASRPAEGARRAPMLLENASRPAEGARRAPMLLENAPRPAEEGTPGTSSGAPLQIQNSPHRSEELSLRTRDE